MHKHTRTLLVAAAVTILAGSGLVAQRRGPGVATPEGLAFRWVGPIVGNRVASVAGIPGDPFTYYAGAASGGVWKTTDGGIRWTPVSDAMPVAAIGALAVAPSDPATVWAGTGEAWAIRDSDVIGDGIYKSVDEGKTWTHMGLDETGRIGRIIVNPLNADIVYACAAGRLSGKQQERGVFRTTDGGQHWERMLFVDENTGCSGLSMDAKNPRFLVAGTWQVEMHPWAELSGGPGSGVYISRDGGSKWTKVEGHGLPKSPLGKIDVAIAPTDSNRVYALIQTADQGSLWRSDDGGNNWRVVNWQRGLIGRAGYYIKLAVSPVNADEVLVSNSSFWQSLDGGLTFVERNWGGDNHDIWWDPQNPDRFVITHDAGLSITLQHGRSIQRVNLPVAQNYHVAVDNQVPYYVYSNMQDDGTMRGPAIAQEGAGAGFNGLGNTWEHGLGGCESGFTIPDPVDPNIVWSSCYGNKLTRYDARVKVPRSVAVSMITLDAPPPDVKYRTHWTAPIAVDPFDHNTVYYGAQVIFATNNGGQSWKVISPDLSTQDPSRIVSSGGIVGDNLGQFAGEVVFAIAPSDVQKGLIWAGTNDGKLWYTKDGGGKWNDVTKNMTGMPSWGVVSKIEPSHFDAGTAYVAVDAHLMDSREPFIFKTTDFGATWKRVNGDLPNKSPLSYVKAVAEDPNKKGVLFAGTGRAFYYSLDDGGHWTELSAGLPHAPVSWVTVQKQFHDVVISTYGRGLYILDDITPLEKMADRPARTTSNDGDAEGGAKASTARQEGSARVQDGSARGQDGSARGQDGSARGQDGSVRGQDGSARGQEGSARLQPSGTTELYPPRPTYRFSRLGRGIINYSLAAAAKDAPKIQILQGDTVVRELTGSNRAGINRVNWDLRHTPPRLVELRALPDVNPHIMDEPRFRGRDTRPVTHWGLDPAEVGPIVAPGKYTVKLTVDGQSHTQPLEVLKDPRMPSTDADLEQSVKLQLRIRDDVNQAADMINDLEIMRAQLQVMQRAALAQKKADLAKSIADMERRMFDVESKLLEPSQMTSDDKYFQQAYKVYMNLLWLNGEVGPGAGDVAGGADFKPTDTSSAVLGDIEKDLAAAKVEYQKLLTSDLPAFNRAMAEKGLTAIVK